MNQVAQLLSDFLRKITGEHGPEAADDAKSLVLRLPSLQAGLAQLLLLLFIRLLLLPQWCYGVAVHGGVLLSECIYAHRHAAARPSSEGRGRQVSVSGRGNSSA
jgi:hypothetical protein